MLLSQCCLRMVALLLLVGHQRGPIEFARPAWVGDIAVGTSRQSSDKCLLLRDGV